RVLCSSRVQWLAWRRPRAVRARDCWAGYREGSMTLSRGGLGDPGADQSGAVADLNLESLGVIAGTQPEPRERGFRKTFLLPLQKGFFRVTLTQVLVPLGEIAFFETSHGRFVVVRRVTSRGCLGVGAVSD